MNCKPGDLVVMIRSDFPENVGKLLTVLCGSPIWPGEWECESLCPMRSSFGPVPAGAKAWAFDADLRPIRDNDGVDEVIARVGKPVVHELPLDAFGEPA